jgi:hypothetical protein
MITFNELSSRVANTLGRVNDHALRERAKAAFKDAFATRIRQTTARGGIDSILLLSVTIPIILDTEKSISKFKVYKTTTPVPTPLRFNNDAPFTYVGINKPTDDLVPFSFRSEMEIRASLKKKLDGLFRYYTYASSTIRLYLKSSFQVYTVDLSDVQSVYLTTMYEDLEEVASFYTRDDVGDYPIPYPRDMIESILQEILKTEFNYNTQDNEVKS